MFIIQFNLPFKLLHSWQVLLCHELLDTAAVALRNMEGELVVMRSFVVVGTAVVGTVAVLADSSYLYLQQPHLLVQHNQLAER